MTLQELNEIVKLNTNTLRLHQDALKTATTLIREQGMQIKKLQKRLDRRALKNTIQEIMNELEN